ncbi:MAG: sigma-70 family RNA polymerase sigma factor [Bacteroidetes bacterium]|nr:sigma-70 family RNA polymerase sigma factor [Bacteroidota bacterium]
MNNEIKHDGKDLPMDARAAVLDEPISYENSKDYELAIACQSGDRKAFQRLVRQYQEKVRGLVYSILSDPDTMDDLVQEIFIKVYTSINRFEHRSNLGTWIYRIAVNHCRDEIRRRRVRRFFSMEKMELDPMEMSPTADKALLKKERIELVRWGLSKVSEKHRTIIVLRDFEDMSYEQIAEVLNLELGTVKSRLNRARLALKDVISPFWHQESLNDAEHENESM